jgi:hypothetical protein
LQLRLEDVASLVSAAHPSSRILLPATRNQNPVQTTSRRRPACILIRISPVKLELLRAVTDVVVAVVVAVVVVVVAVVVVALVIVVVRIYEDQN